MNGGGVSEFLRLEYEDGTAVYDAASPYYVGLDRGSRGMKEEDIIHLFYGDTTIPSACYEDYNGEPVGYYDYYNCMMGPLVGATEQEDRLADFIYGDVTAFARLITQPLPEADERARYERARRHARELLPDLAPTSLTEADLADLIYGDAAESGRLVAKTLLEEADARYESVRRHARELLADLGGHTDLTEDDLADLICGDVTESARIVEQSLLEQEEEHEFYAPLT